MGTYSFFLEYDGRKTSSSAYQHPVDTINAEHITEAIKKFSKKNRLAFNNYDSLLDQGYRVYFNKKSLGKKREMIYFVEHS